MCLIANENLLFYFIDLFGTAFIQQQHSDQRQYKTQNNHALTSFLANFALIF